MIPRTDISTDRLRPRNAVKLRNRDGPPRPVVFLRRGIYRWLLIRFILFEFHHLYSTIPHGFSYFANEMHREEAESLLLVVIERLIERLPRIGDLFEAGRIRRSSTAGRRLRPPQAPQSSGGRGPLIAAVES
jgi:hypothetical protein